MKCLHCGRDSKLNERLPNHACPQCARRFAFEPTDDPLKVTDALFQSAVRAVSSNESLYFTERQLWYEFNRRLAGRAWWQPIFTAAFVCFMLGGCLDSLWQLRGLWFVLPIVASVLVGLAAYGRHWLALSRPSVSLETFRQKYLGPWNQVHGPPEKLLPPMSRRATRPMAREPDLTSYSFDRALVTDQSAIAAMLVANNYHFENNCAVLSTDGFPPGRLLMILDMLKRNPQLIVTALHNASAEGCRLPLVLRGPQWFPDRSITIHDLGLRPRHVTRKLPFGKPWMAIQGVAQVVHDEAVRGFTRRELAWLKAGHVVELDVMRPAALMRALYRGMGQAADAIAKKRADKHGEAGDGGVWTYHGTGNQSEGEPDEGDYTASDFDDGDSAAGDFEAADSFG